MPKWHKVPIDGGGAGFHLETLCPMENAAWVPRPAKSIDDLRVGQTVAYLINGKWFTGTVDLLLIGVYQPSVQLTPGVESGSPYSLLAFDAPGVRWIILTDPVDEIEEVRKDLLDDVAEALEAHGGARCTVPEDNGVLEAVRALINSRDKA